jgi:hypothetical protein
MVPFAGKPGLGKIATPSINHATALQRYCLVFQAGS